jgi:UDP-2-acetamido-3-amino-2,3-dideoxy-glucuronate N-acetyltransferase
VNSSALERVKQVSVSIPFTTNQKDILENSSINGVVIASPAETHFELAKQFLESGKHVLVEKPITLHSNEARQLIEIAKKNHRQLMVGHVLLYHPAILKLKELCAQGKIGTLQYIYSNRLNLGAIRREENILWSFAPHDISIIQYLTESKPLEIATHGAHFVQSGIEDTTISYLKYPNNVHAHIFVSWLHPFKEQRLVVIGDKGMFVFEDSVKTDKLKFYPKGFQQTQEGVAKFDGEFESIPFKDAQPLAEEHKHFYECIIHNRQPLTDGVHALEVLEILEQATQRLKYG